MTAPHSKIHAASTANALDEILRFPSLSCAVSSVSLVHAFTGFRQLGGVESILQKHWREDVAFGLDSRFWSFFETPPDDDPRVLGLNLSWRSTIRSARVRLRNCLKARDQTVIYHNCWGLPFLADLDRSHRRLGMLHSDWPGLADCLRSFPGWVDGMMVVSEPLRTLVQNVWPGLPPDRIALVPYPIAPEGTDHAPPPLRGRPLVIGYCGRLIKAQKRVDRFPAFVALLDASALDYRLELLGDGPDGPKLRSALGAHPRVRFHGRLSGSTYWQTIRTWDAIVFLSEYEGLPLALLEAMAAGVIPVFPAIGSGGDEYTAGVDRSLLYRAGDLSAALQALRQLHGLGESQRDVLRSRATSLVSKHIGSGYLTAFARFVQGIATAPPLVAPPTGLRPFRWTDYCPFGILRRVRQSAFWQPSGSPS